MASTLLAATVAPVRGCMASYYCLPPTTYYCPVFLLLPVFLPHSAYLDGVDSARCDRSSRARLHGARGDGLTLA